MKGFCYSRFLSIKDSIVRREQSRRRCRKQGFAGRLQSKKIHAVLQKKKCIRAHVPWQLFNGEGQHIVYSFDDTADLNAARRTAAGRVRYDARELGVRVSSEAAALRQGPSLSLDPCDGVEGVMLKG